VPSSSATLKRMPVTNPWLAGPAPTAPLDRERLAERILNLLSSQNMCVVATSGSDGPLATPVRYYHLDFRLLFTAAPDSPKMRNLAVDPRVSVGIFAPPVVIEAERIVYTEYWLRREGFAPRQVWRREPGVAGVANSDTPHALIVMRRVVTDAVRAVETAAAHPRVDAGRIVVQGGSQGGAIAQAVAALRPGLVAALIDVPFLTHFRRALTLIDSKSVRVARSRLVAWPA
jgi:hypothetical protein